MQTRGMNISDKVRSEVEYFVATVETRLHETIF